MPRGWAGRTEYGLEGALSIATEPQSLSQTGGRLADSLP